MTHRDDTIPYGFCHCGCGQRTKVSSHNSRERGHINGEPVRYIRGHWRKSGPLFTVEDRGYKTPCWIWQRAHDRLGYGRVRSNGKKVLSHVAMFMEKYGPVPDGKELDHLCRVPACCNPEHLEPVTHAENIRRSPMTKLTKDQVVEIRALKSIMPAKAIGARYGVAKSTVRAILINKKWVEETTDHK